MSKQGQLLERFQQLLITKVLVPVKLIAFLLHSQDVHENPALAVTISNSSNCPNRRPIWMIRDPIPLSSGGMRRILKFRQDSIKAIMVSMYVLVELQKNVLDGLNLIDHLDL